jgi:hypothetical protein
LVRKGRLQALLQQFTTLNLSAHDDSVNMSYSEDKNSQQAGGDRNAEPEEMNQIYESLPCPEHTGFRTGKAGVGNQPQFGVG